ncbi:hypothetical protein HOY80DRAFT_703080 [Tuber brumale]|nr:hypothetical protein HOY80DRAFT_703080 [Tuber brumale]
MGLSGVLRIWLMSGVGAHGYLIGRVLSKRKRREGKVSFRREQGRRHLAWVGRLCKWGGRGVDSVVHEPSGLEPARVSWRCCRLSFKPSQPPTAATPCLIQPPLPTRASLPRIAP